MVEVIPQPNNVGAEIRGVDIAKGVSDAQFETVRDSLHRHSVVWLRNQDMTVQQQLDFARRFGAPEPHNSHYLVPGFREVILISNILDDSGKPIGITDAGRMWHTDGHMDKRPTMYSLLHAREIPHDDAGEPLGPTWFASTADAYDDLPEETKKRIDGLIAENNMTRAVRWLEANNLATNRAPLTEKQKQLVGVHPVARTHPATGRKCIYVSDGQTEKIRGMEEAEARRLIKQLQDAIIEEKHIYRHRWQVGDLLIWDNCSAQHYAIGNYALPQRRLMHRVSVAGMETF